MSLRLGGDGAITGCSSLSEPALTLSGLTVSGQISTVSGTAAAPGVTFVDDNDTGIYSPAANTLGITTNGTERLRVDDTGKIGIGTNSPDTKLHVFSEAISQSWADNAADLIKLEGTVEGINFVNASTGFLAFSDANARARGLIEYLHVSDSMQFDTAGSERMRIASNGRVGIGTTDIDGQLEVRSSGALGIISRVTATQSTDGNKAFKARNNSDTDTFSVSYRGQGYFAGSVGIGTSSPQSELTVRGSTPQITLEPTADTQNCRLQFCTTNGTVQSTIQSGGVDGSRIEFVQGSSERMRIDTNGSVGINTASLSSGEKLKVTLASSSATSVNGLNGLTVESNADTGISILTPNSNIGSIAFGDPQNGAIGRIRYSHSSNYLLFQTNGSEKMRIDSNGNVGIGVTAPDCKLHIVDALGGGQLLVATSDSNNTTKYGSFGGVHYNTGEQPVLGMSVQTDNSFNTIKIGGGHHEFNAATDIRIFTASNNSTTTGTQHLAIKNDGSIRFNQDSTNTPGFGNTTTGLAVEHISSGAALFISRSDSTALFLNRNNDGSILNFRRSGTEEGYINITTTGVSLVSTSDYRLKENAVSIADGITRVKQLQPKRFNFITDPSTTVDGFMAHEVQTVVPEATFGEHDAVDAEGNPEYQGVDQSKLIPLLTAALKEAISKIEILESEVATLKAST